VLQRGEGRRPTRIVIPTYSVQLSRGGGPSLLSAALRQRWRDQQSDDDLGRRRGVATADARRAHHANARAGAVLQLMQQFFRTQHGAGQGVADANGQRRDIGLALLHHVEMRIEGRGLEHFRKRQFHLVGKGCEVGCGNLMIFVLDQMQMLDQQIAPRGRSPSKTAISSAAWDRPGGPWGSISPAFVPRRDARTSGPDAHHDSLKRLVHVSASRL